MAGVSCIDAQALTVSRQRAGQKANSPNSPATSSANIVRARGSISQWIIDTTIHLDDASGKLVSFPYPMSGISGDLRIHDDSLELTNFEMRKGDASLKIDGRISWPHVSDDVPAEQLPPVRLPPNLGESPRADVPEVDSDFAQCTARARASGWANSG